MTRLSMTSSLTLHRCAKSARALALALPLATGLAVGQAAPAHAATCPTPATQAERLALVGELSLATYSIDKMDCAATLALAAARAAPDDVGVQAMALGVIVHTIDLMGSVKRADLMGAEKALVVRIGELGKEGVALAAAARARAPDNPDLKVLQALVFALAGPWLSVEESVVMAHNAMTLLDEVVRTAPDTLGGTAQLALGRIYYELPPMLGGDIRRSISLLEDARKRNPDSIQAMRYLAESYDQDLEEAKAVETLKAMLPVEAGPGHYQLVADELNQAIGLARRLQAGDLAGQLDTRRKALLAAHPELLTRESSAVNGHGGDNPLKEP